MSNNPRQYRLEILSWAWRGYYTLLRIPRCNRVVENRVGPVLLAIRRWARG